MGRVGPGLLLVSEKFLSRRDGKLRAHPTVALQSSETWRDPFPDYGQWLLTPTPSPTPSGDCLPFPWGLGLTNFQVSFWEGPLEGGWSLGPPITQANTSLLRSTLSRVPAFPPQNPKTQKDYLLSPSIQRGPCPLLFVYCSCELSIPVWAS